jgi:hypothetical protein
MANKKLTLGEVEKLRKDMNSTIIKAIQGFEKVTGLRTGYINITRKKDQERSEGCTCIEPYNADRGPVVQVATNLDMEL